MAVYGYIVYSCLSLLAQMTARGMRATGARVYHPLGHSRLVHMVAISGFPRWARESEGQHTVVLMPLFATGLLMSHWTKEVAWSTQTQGTRNKFHLLMEDATVSHNKGGCRKGKTCVHFYNQPHC